MNEAVADEGSTYKEKVDHEVDDHQGTLNTDNVIEESDTNLDENSENIRDNVIRESASSIENEDETDKSEILQNPHQDLTEHSQGEDGMGNDNTESSREVRCIDKVFT